MPLGPSQLLRRSLAQRLGHARLVAATSGLIGVEHIRINADFDRHLDGRFLRATLAALTMLAISAQPLEKV